jgi:hypothetical protein
MTTILLALVNAVYRRFLVKSIGGPKVKGITNTGNSEP